MTAAAGGRQLEVQLGHDVRVFDFSAFGRGGEDRADEQLPAVDQPDATPSIWTRGTGCLDHGSALGLEVVGVEIDDTLWRGVAHEEGLSRDIAAFGALTGRFGERWNRDVAEVALDESRDVGTGLRLWVRVVPIVPTTGGNREGNQSRSEELVPVSLHDA